MCSPPLCARTRPLLITQPVASVRRPRTKWPFKHAERRAALRSSGGPPAWANPHAPKSPSRYAAQNTAATVAKTGLARAALQKTPHTTARPSSSNVPPRQNIHSRYRGTRRVPLRRPLVANKPRHFGKSIGSHRLSERKEKKTRVKNGARTKKVSVPAGNAREGTLDRLLSVPNGHLFPPPSLTARPNGLRNDAPLRRLVSLLWYSF